MRALYAWMAMAAGAVVVFVGTWLLLGRDSEPSPPHHDMAGPEFSSHDVTLIAIGLIVLGCGILALGAWLRRKKRIVVRG